ncbi:MAG: DUF4178 domain-containing protein [Myxococcaceae bacterium]
MTTGVAAACPQCGAPLRFGGGASLATVCAYCRFAVLRTGARLDAAGKVPDLVATDTRLSIGTAGKAQGRTFTLLGRLQLSQGEAVWNEWYGSFGDASWGWVAEAQGRLYVTFPVPGAAGLPPLSALRPGAELQLPGLGRAVVDEVNTARLVSFEGELPVRPEPGEQWHYADCSTEGGGFATLDYGAGGEPVLYAGREESYAEAGLADAAPLAATSPLEPARALRCPSCGGPIELRRPDSKAFACPSCGSLLDVSRGTFQVLGVLHSRSKPPIPLGAKGTLLGESLEVLGYLVRSTVVDGQLYSWQEFLLHGPGGYRWLSVFNGHWLFLQPIAAAQVMDTGLTAGRAWYQHRAFKHFQSAEARYAEIQGEFYWEIRAGEAVKTVDFVAPPLLLSAERTETEISWSRGQSVTGEEVWKAFKLPGAPPPVVGVGAAQPNPFSARMGASWKVAGIALAGLLLVSAVLAARAPRQEVLALDVPLTPGEVTLSPPFELTGGPQAVEVTAEAAVVQAWVGLDVALIEDETGESETVALELASFFGVEDGEAWSEGSRSGSAVIGSVRDGRYLLRVEPQIERGQGKVPPTAHVRVLRGVFLLTPLVFALLLVVAWPLVLLLRMASFERRRWQQSDHPWGGS